MATSRMSEVIQHLHRSVLLPAGAGLTDGQLLEDYLSRRNETALAVLVGRHGPMVWGVCRRVLRNTHDAEDAFQATFLVLIRRAASIASRASVGNWLYGVAHQTALKARATSAKRGTREKQVTALPEPAVEEQDLWRDLEPLLDEELSRLPDKYRAVIVLCDLEGKTRREAAWQLGCPEGTVAGWLARARTRLARRLTQRGIALTSGALMVLSWKSASPGVPTSVVTVTIKAAGPLTAGTAATGMISLEAAALAKEVLKAMLMNKLKSVGAIVLMLSFLVTGATVPLLGGQAGARVVGEEEASERTDDQRAYGLIKEYRALSDRAKVSIDGDRIKERLRQLSQTDQIVLSDRARDAIARLLAEQSLRELVAEQRAKRPARAEERNWTLDFQYKTPRCLVLNVPGEGRKSVSYLWCKVGNKLGKTVAIAPTFDIVTDAEREAVRAGKAPAAVLAAIQSAEDPTQYYGLRDLAAIQSQSLKPTTSTRPNAERGPMVGVVTWDAENSASRTLTVFVSGLSNESRDEKKGVLLKTLKLTFRREKDEHGVWGEYSLVSQEWVYRLAAGTKSGGKEPTPQATEKSNDTRPLGRILRTPIRGDRVYINVGKEDNIRPKMAFSVYGAGSKPAKRRPKASLEVLTVIGAHLSLARVTSLLDPDDPVVQGDQLYKPPSKEHQLKE
jgi:RNA polymerase sigma factor (sigma-70 family)